MLCLVAQSCPTLCNPMDCSPPGSSVHGDSPGKNTGVGCHTLLKGIFPTQGLNPGLPHCRQILYQLSSQGSPHKPVESLLFFYCSICFLSCEPPFNSKSAFRGFLIKLELSKETSLQSHWFLFTHITFIAHGKCILFSEILFGGPFTYFKSHSSL